jgi:hypothetical protein
MHQGPHSSVTTQSDGEVMAGETHVTTDGAEDLRPSTLGWQNATRSSAPCINGTERNITEHETPSARSFVDRRAVNLSSGRGGYYQQQQDERRSRL